MTVLEKRPHATQAEAPAVPVVDFDTHPDRYRHWRLAVDGDVATRDPDGRRGRRAGRRATR